MSPHHAIFLTINPLNHFDTSSRNSIPSGLKLTYRSFNMVKPDYELIIENLLLLIGVTQGRLLSIRLWCFINFVGSNLVGFEGAMMGLRFVRRIVNRMQTLESVKKNPNLAMVEAIVFEYKGNETAGNEAWEWLRRGVQSIFGV